MFNVFVATYSETTSGRGSYTTYIKAVVIATDQDDALNQVSKEYPDTKKTKWEFEQIDTAVRHVEYLDSGEINH